MVPDFRIQLPSSTTGFGLAPGELKYTCSELHYRIGVHCSHIEGGLKFSLFGPNGDPILSEMGTKWGPSTVEMGTQKAYISKLTKTS